MYISDNIEMTHKKKLYLSEAVNIMLKCWIIVNIHSANPLVKEILRVIL